MMVYILGSLGFLLFFIYDWNSIALKSRLLQKSFLLGCIFNVLAAGTMIAQAFCTAIPARLVRCVIFGALALITFAGLIYTLFFALPFEETYVSDNERRPAYTKKMYALCRHPGVLWYGAFFLSLAGFLGSGTALVQGIFLTFLNVLYVIYQDLVVFPKTFTDYGAYKTTTPFLIPNGESVKRCRADFKER